MTLYLSLWLQLVAMESIISFGRIVEKRQMVFGLLCALGGLAVFISLRDLRGFTASESIGQRRVSKQTGTD